MVNRGLIEERLQDIWGAQDSVPVTARLATGYLQIALAVLAYLELPPG